MQCGRKISNTEEIQRLTVPAAEYLVCSHVSPHSAGDSGVYPACRQELCGSAEQEGSSVMQCNAMHCHTGMGYRALQCNITLC